MLCAWVHFETTDLEQFLFALFVVTLVVQIMGAPTKQFVRYLINKCQCPLVASKHLLSMTYMYEIKITSHLWKLWRNLVNMTFDHGRLCYLCFRNPESFQYLHSLDLLLAAWKGHYQNLLYVELWCSIVLQYVFKTAAWADISCFTWTKSSISLMFSSWYLFCRHWSPSLVVIFLE